MTFGLGNGLLAGGRADAAIAEYQQALTLQPESAAAHFHLASAHEEQPRIGEAGARTRVAAGSPTNAANFSLSSRLLRPWYEKLQLGASAAPLIPTLVAGRG